MLPVLNPASTISEAYKAQQPRARLVGADDARAVSPVMGNDEPVRGDFDDNMSLHARVRMHCQCTSSKDFSGVVIAGYTRASRQRHGLSNVLVSNATCRI